MQLFRLLTTIWIFCICAYFSSSRDFHPLFVGAEVLQVLNNLNMLSSVIFSRFLFPCAIHEWHAHARSHINSMSIFLIIHKCTCMCVLFLKSICKRWLWCLTAPRLVIQCFYTDALKDCTHWIICPTARRAVGSARCSAHRYLKTRNKLLYTHVNFMILKWFPLCIV